MPIRLVRPGINSSDRVDALTCGAEVFYRRLMSAVDDYGRTEGDWRVLRANLYPKKHDITQEQIEGWVAECTQVLEAEEEPLIHAYTVGRKLYLEITNFGQRTRTKSKCPSREQGERENLRANDSAPPQIAARATNTNTNSPSHSTPPPNPNPNPEAPDCPPSEPLFDELVKTYPPAGRERIERARIMLRQVLAEELERIEFGPMTLTELRREMLEGLARWKISERWMNGRIHLLHNWLTERLWREYPVAASQAKLAAKPSLPTKRPSYATALAEGEVQNLEEYERRYSA